MDDACKVPKKQERLPDLRSASSPNQDIIAQLDILEQVFRPYRHIDCLIGIRDKLTLKQHLAGHIPSFCKYLFTL